MWVQKNLSTMLRVGVLVAGAITEPAYPCRLLGPADASGYLVHPVRRCLEDDQVRAGPDIRPGLLCVVERTQQAETIYLFITSDWFQVTTPSGNLTT